MAAQDRPSIQLVGVDVNRQDTPAQFASWLRSNQLTSTRFLWTIDTDGGLVQRYQVSSLGATAFLDHSGHVRFLNPGPAPDGTLRQQLSQLG